MTTKNLSPSRFKNKSLALFFIVSLVPALVVAAVWYVNAMTQGLESVELDFQTYVVPVFFLGILPALVLSFAFAELLSRPVRRIHIAILELSRGNFSHRTGDVGSGEFHEINIALDQVSTKLEMTLSQAASETALIEAERNKLTSVLNSMTDGVFALDQSGRIILFNKAACELTGRTITSVAGQLAEKVMPFRKSGELVMTRWLATQKGNGHQVGRWRNLELYRADGTSLFVDVQAVTLSNDPNGIAALITFHDLTAQSQLEQMKVDFVALAAHELRTPLTEIKGYLDILQHEAKSLTKENREFLTRSLDSANQLTGLVNNLLGVARIEHGDLNYHPEPVDYVEFIRNFTLELEERYAANRHLLELKLPDKLPLVMADVIGLREVLMNLVTNAVNHVSLDSGRIIIIVRKHQDQIETSITDNGTGIPAEAMPRLFTKFFRVDTMRSATRGTGLGLYICRSIIEAHGGRIWAESTEDEGSTFTFRLPLAPVADKKLAAHNTAKITRGAHGWIKNNSLR